MTIDKNAEKRMTELYKEHGIDQNDTLCIERSKLLEVITEEELEVLLKQKKAWYPRKARSIVFYSTVKIPELRKIGIATQIQAYLFDIDTAEEKSQLERTGITQHTDEKIDLIMKKYINALHDYNNMKDCGQCLLGKLAGMQGRIVKSLYDTFGLSLDD